MPEQIVESGKAWANTLIDLYKAGAGDAEVAAAMQITIKAFYNELDNPVFSQLVEYGRTLSQAYWEKQARANLNNKQFNTSLWAFWMKNKYGWADKTESISLTDSASTDLDSLRGQVMKDVAKFIKDNTPELIDAQRLLADMSAAKKLYE
jgi:hypothetical protein